MRHLTADDRCGHRRRLVAMAYDRINEVSFCELALRGGETALLLRPKLQSGAQCTVSPDAEWISCATRGAHEDLVLLRSGAWNYWWIRTDGSDLRQITAFFDFNGGVIPPDGKQVALNADYKGLVVVDLNVGKPVDWNSVKALPEPEGYSEAMFGPAAWSPDGRFIAGFETGTSGRAEGYAIYDLTEDLCVDSISPRTAGPSSPAGCRIRATSCCADRRVSRSWRLPRSAPALRYGGGYDPDDPRRVGLQLGGPGPPRRGADDPGRAARPGDLAARVRVGRPRSLPLPTAEACSPRASFNGRRART